MPCFHPIKAYRVPEVKSPTGKDKIVFYKSSVFKPYRPDSDRAISLPCGKCDGCLESRTKSWAVRCFHESLLWRKPEGNGNCFITLTFDEKHLNDSCSLVKADFQKFMKRLRERVAPLRYASCYPNPRRLKVDKVFAPWGVRYFHCGEYGEKGGRPHHHACLFNFDFPDKKLLREKRGVKLYRSALLEELWPFGFSTVGDVTWESACYVARYVYKKFAKAADVDADNFSGQIDEYVTMSRRSGIGKGWYDKYGKTDVYVTDDVLVNGRSFRPPKYYDKLLELTDPEKRKMLSEKRCKGAKGNPDNSPQRLLIREQIKKDQLKRLNKEREI